ncbi:MAG: hypothetical protein ACRCWS_02510 [Propionibacteriaceae bacterium]
MSLATRIAWRTSRRPRGQSTLIIFLVFLPVFCLSAFMAFTDSGMPSDAERFGPELGSAQAVIYPMQRITMLSSGSNQLPAGQACTQYVLSPHICVDGPGRALVAGGERPDLSAWQVVSEQSGLVTVDWTTARGGKQIHAVAVIADAGLPVFAGRFTLRKGQWPQPDQVLLTQDVASRLGVTPGSAVTVANRQLTVSGIVEVPYRTKAEIIIPTTAPVVSAVVNQPAEQRLYLSGERTVTWTDLMSFNDRGWAGLSAEVLRHLPAAPVEPRANSYPQLPGFYGRYEPIALVWLMGIGVLGMVVSLTVARTAFVVGAERQQRQLALLAATGAAGTTLRTIARRQAVVLGGIGAVLGAVFGPVCGWCIGRLLSGDDYHCFGFHPAIPFAMVAALGTWAATILAARGAGRRVLATSPLAALRTSVIVPPRPRWTRSLTIIVAISALLILAGYGSKWLLMPELYSPVKDLIRMAQSLIFVGLITMVLPWGFDWFSRRRHCPAAVRFALRNVARHPRRSVPVMLTTALVTAVVAMILVFAVGSDASKAWIFAKNVRQGHILITTTTQAETDCARDAIVSMSGEPRNSSVARIKSGITLRSLEPSVEHRWMVNSYELTIGESEHLEFLLGRAATMQEREALATGKAIVFNAAALDATGMFTVEEYGPTGSTTLLHAPGYIAATVAGDNPGIFISSELAAANKIAANKIQLRLEYDRRIEQDEASEIRTTLSATVQEAQVEIQWQPSIWEQYRGWIDAAIATFIALLIICTAGVLVSIEGKTDVATLAAVGASARCNAWVSALALGLMALVSTVLGVAAGSFAALSRERREQLHSYGVATPWLPQVSIVLVVTLVAMVTGYLAVPRRITLTRRID